MPIKTKWIKDETERQKMYNFIAKKIANTAISGVTFFAFLVNRFSMTYERIPIDMPSDRVFITNNVPIINEKTDLLYEQVGNVDFDIDYDFQLQTHSYNALVELANPLLATALRLRKLSSITLRLKNPFCVPKKFYFKLSIFISYL